MADVIEVISTAATVVQVNTVGPQGPQGPPGESASLLYASGVGDSVLSTEVGGADPELASVWKTRTLSEALDVILFPTVSPSISTAKSVALTVSGLSGVLEVGTVVNRTLTATFDRGRITNGNGTLGPELVGPAISFTYSGTAMGTPVPNVGTHSLGNVPVVLGSNNWAVTVVHQPGTGLYFDNKGNASTALDADRNVGQPNGTVSDSTSSPIITGVYPWYYLKSPVSFTPAQFKAAIMAGNATAIHTSAVLSKVVGDASGTISVPYNLSNQFLGVAYQSALTTKATYYVTDLDNGSITSVFNAVATQQDVATSLWSVEYKMHITPLPLTPTQHFS
jgi:hypothetical protein